MKTLLLSLPLFALLCGPAFADDKEAPKADSEPVAALKTHLRNFFSLDAKKIAAGYAPNVRLVEGHEFLKPEHGLVDGDEDDTRSTPLVVTRERYVAAILKLLAGEETPPADEIEKMIGAAIITALEPEAAAGEKTLDPADKVGSADGKLHFVVEKGDVFVKFQPRPEADHAYFQFRKIDGRWLVVGEYAD